MHARPGEDDAVELRIRILELVRKYPGLHLREIQRQLATSAALAEYHLNLLEKWGLATSVESDGYRRFFPATTPAADLSRAEKAALGVLRQRIPLGVVLFLLDRGAAAHAEVAEALGIRKSTLSYHLQRLEATGIIQRGPDARTFLIPDAPRILGLLRAHEPTPDLVGAYADLWTTILGTLRGGKP